MKAALVGLGAIGTVIAADLAKNNFPLYVVCKRKEVFETVKERGLKVTGVSGEYTVRKNITPVLKIEDLPTDLELVFLVTKLNDIQDAYERLKSKLVEDYTLVTLTNGMIEDALGSIIDGNKLLGCVVSFGASRSGPAESVKTSLGEMFLGRVKGKKNPIDDKLVELFSHTVPTNYSEEIINEKFSKLLINLAVTSFGVVSGMTLGEMLSRKMTRIAFLTAMTEGVKVAKAKGIKLPTLNNLQIESLALEKSELQGFSFKHFRKQLIIKIIGRRYKRLRSSSLQSIEMGRKTEIDYLNGYLVSEGKRLGIETPLNKYVLDEVHLIEGGKKKPSFEGLIQLEQKTKEIWEI